MSPLDTLWNKCCKQINLVWMQSLYMENKLFWFFFFFFLFFFRCLLVLLDPLLCPPHHESPLPRLPHPAGPDERGDVARLRQQRPQPRHLHRLQHRVQEVLQKVSPTLLLQERPMRTVGGGSAFKRTREIFFFSQTSVLFLCVPTAEFVGVFFVFSTKKLGQGSQDEQHFYIMRPTRTDFYMQNVSFQNKFLEKNDRRWWWTGCLVVCRPNLTAALHHFSSVK